MRSFLDKLYGTAGYAAAFFMVGTLLMVVAGIADRILALGWRGTDMFAGYCMAAAGFLALAHTLKRCEHLRVSLILSAVSAGPRRMLELWSLFAASVLSGALAFYSIKLAYQSREFHDVSIGLDATPLWIPQLGMAIGTVVLFIAFVDDFFMEVSGRRVALATDELLRSE